MQKTSTKKSLARKIFKVCKNNSAKLHIKVSTDVYRTLIGDLSLWSVMANECSLGKNGHIEQGMKHKIYI